MLITCARCATVVEKSNGEIRRRQKQGHTTFFCTRQCANAHIGGHNKKPACVKQCPYCGNEFASTAKAKASTYCSRYCASIATVTPERRARMRHGGVVAAKHLILVGEALKIREKHKYVEIAAYLVDCGEPHEFEVTLGPESRVFDLALTTRRFLIEFDGPWHSGPQHTDDMRKTQQAVDLGWQVFRIRTDAGVIHLASVRDSLDRILAREDLRPQ